MPKTFEELSEMPTESIKPPPLLPKGSYLVGITGPAEVTNSSQKQTPGYKVRYKFYQARPDVDRDELEKFMDEGNLSLNDVDWEDDWWITERSINMFKEFYTDVLRLNAANPKQAAADMGGQQLIITIGHTPTKRPDGKMGLRAQIIGRAPAD